jgi:hypothetical protein
MKDIVISTIIILLIAMSATVIGHLAMTVSDHVAALASHKALWPVSFPLHARPDLLRLIWA